MASVTVYSAAKIDEITNEMVVGATISDGRLILQLRNDTTVDAGPVISALYDATTDSPGVVELATDDEVIAGVDDFRVITPFGLASLTATTDRKGLIELATNAEVVSGSSNSLAVTPSGLRGVRVISAVGENDGADSYPPGVSVMSLASTSWSLNGGSGTVVTNYANGERLFQTFNTNTGGSGVPRSWVRQYHSSSGWTGWHENLVMYALDAASFTQATALSTYPQGESRMYYTNTTSGSWDFSGKWGEVRTSKYGSDYAVQFWTRHANGASPYAVERWYRTANTASGWSPWYVLAADTGWVNITYSSGFSAGTAQQLQYRVRDGVMYLRGGATGTFTDASYTAVCPNNSIPTAYRPPFTIRGGACGSNARQAIYEINATNGNVLLGYNGGTAPTWIAFTCAYPIGDVS